MNEYKAQCEHTFLKTTLIEKKLHTNLKDIHIQHINVLQKVFFEKKIIIDSNYNYNILSS